MKSWSSKKKGFYLQVVYYIREFIQNPWLSFNFYGFFSYEIHFIKRFAILVLQENKQNIKHTFYQFRLPLLLFAEVQPQIRIF